MGYEIKVEGEDNRGLPVWLVAMTGLACDVETHDGQVVVGEISRVKPYEHGGPVFHLAQVDPEGRKVTNGYETRLRADDVKKVNIW